MTNLRHLILILAFTGCAVPADDPVDGANDTFLGDGKSDTGAVVDGTPEARAVLRLANSATLDTLDHEVPLDARAAANIIAARPIATLAELDAVSYVGPVAFGNLLEYAQTRTWRDWLPADFSFDVVVMVPVRASTWSSIAQSGPYTPKDEVMTTTSLALLLRDEGARVTVGTLEVPAKTIAENGTFSIGRSYSGLTGPHNRFLAWGSLSISGTIDSLGDVVVTSYSRFAGRGNSIYGYNGTQAVSTGEGRAPLP